MTDDVYQMCVVKNMDAQETESHIYFASGALLLSVLIISLLTIIKLVRAKRI